MFDVSTLWLKLSYFTITHKQEFRKWWIILLLAVSIFIIVFVFTNVVLFLLGIPRHNKLMLVMAENQVAYQAIREQVKPTPLQVISVFAIPAGNGKYDLVAQVQNKNDSWAASGVRYEFSINNEAGEIMTESIMPNSEAFLTDFNVNVAQASDDVEVSIQIADVEWRRVSDLDKLAVVDFAVEDIQYTTARANDLVAHWVKAKVTNKSFNGFWRARFIVLLYSGDRVVGVNYTYFDQFRSGETRSLAVQWDRVDGTVTGVAILPAINILDEDNVIR